MDCWVFHRAPCRNGSKGADIRPVRPGHCLPSPHAVLTFCVRCSSSLRRSTIRSPRGIEDIAVTLRHAPSLVREPMRGNGNGVLQSDEKIQYHDLACGAILAKSFCGSGEHFSDARDCVADGGELVS